MVRYGVVRYGMTWYGLVSCAMVWFNRFDSLVWYTMMYFVLLCYGSVVLHKMKQYGMGCYSKVSCDKIEYGMVRYAIVW